MSRKLYPIEAVIYITVTAQVARSISWRFVRNSVKLATKLENESDNVTLISVPMTHSVAGWIRRLLTAAEDIDDVAHAGVPDLEMVQIRIPEFERSMATALRIIDEYREGVIYGSAPREMLDKTAAKLSRAIEESRK